MKKALAITLALILCLSLLPMTALADGTSGTCGNNLTWSFENGTLTIRGTGNMYDYFFEDYQLNVPWGDYIEQIEAVNISIGVTSIGDYAFFNLWNLTSVVIPDGVTSIGEEALAACWGLMSVTIPKSVTVIGAEAFFVCYPSDIYYGGSEAEWKAILIDDSYDGNRTLYRATIHFSDPTPAEPETPNASDLFTDVKSGEWYEGAVSFAVENGLMYGVDNGKFDPDGTTTRAQLMTILARLDGADTEGGDPWYEKAMVWAMENGISDGSDPDGELTREQLATMLWRYAGKPETDAGYDAFADADSVHDWAAQAMAWAVEQGIINGDNGRLKPQDTASRAEMAAMLMRFCGKLEK